MDNPMDKIHALMKRVKEVTEPLNVELLHFVVLPHTDGPDEIACSFSVLPAAVKTNAEVEAEALDDAFMAAIGGVVGDDGKITMSEKEAIDEETKGQREAREALRQERLDKIISDFKEEFSDLYGEDE